MSKEICTHCGTSAEVFNEALVLQISAAAADAVAEEMEALKARLAEAEARTNVLAVLLSRAIDSPDECAAIRDALDTLRLDKLSEYYIIRCYNSRMEEVLVWGAAEKPTLRAAIDASKGGE